MYKKIILIIVMMTGMSGLNAQNARNVLNDRYGLMAVEKVDMRKKLITLNGRVFQYKMLVENSYYDKQNTFKSLKYIKKGEYYYVNISYTDIKSKFNNDDTGVVNFISKIEYAF